MEENTSTINSDKRDTNNRLKDAISAGIDYLVEHQYPNGEFCIYLSPDDEMQEWCYPESNVFCTSVIAGCLIKMRDELRIKTVLHSSGKFLLYQMMRGGLWNYFTKFNPLFKFTPPDVDTTAYTSAVLKSLNINFPDNKDFLLGNIDKRGLFYTWIVWRRGANINRSTFKLLGREFKRPIQTLTFWLKHEVGRNDVDAIVNANALYYFGYNEKTSAIVSYLLEILNMGKEEQSDKWYKNPIVFYYFASRNYSNISQLEPMKPLILARLFSKINEDGSFGVNDLENGIAIATLLNLNYRGIKLQHGIESLLKSQSNSGSWRRGRLFYCGPSKATGWGSEELTTAFCLEALAMYQNQLNFNG